MVFFVIKLKTRIVRVAGIPVDPDEASMLQTMRNLCDPVDRFLRGGTSLLHDGDPLLQKQWTAPCEQRYHQRRHPSTEPEL